MRELGIEPKVVPAKEPRGPVWVDRVLQILRVTVKPASMGLRKVPWGTRVVGVYIEYYMSGYTYIYIVLYSILKRVMRANSSDPQTYCRPSFWHDRRGGEHRALC